MSGIDSFYRQEKRLMRELV